MADLMEELTRDSARAAPNGRVVRRQVRGLRITFVPAWSLIAQVLGAVAVLVGLYMLAGLAVTLIVAGAGAIVIGTLHEAGLLSSADPKT